MKSRYILMTLLCFLSVNALASADKGGNGGGGIIKNGRPQTFYSAGIVTDVSPSSKKDVPSLIALVNDINEMPYLTDDLKTSIISALIPSNERSYFKVLPDSFDKVTEARLIGEYSRLTRQDASNLTLFAVTDTSKKATYLLPNFYSLNPNEQKAILIHEAYWILNPNATYEKVLRVEYAFQGYFENPDDFDRAEAVVREVGSMQDRTKAVIEHDVRVQSLKGLLVNGEVPLSKLLGRDFINCTRTAEWNNCRGLAFANLIRLQNEYPESKFLTLMSEALQNPNAVGIYGSGDSAFYSGGVRPLVNFVGERSDLSSVVLSLKYSCTFGTVCGIALYGKIRWKEYAAASWFSGMRDRETEAAVFVTE